jgi:hypothetical protein
MDELFVSFELALKLNKYFDEKTFRVYDLQGYFQDEKVMESMGLTAVKAPTYSQVIDWFRLKYDQHIVIAPYYNPFFTETIYYDVAIANRDNSYEGLVTNSINRMGEKWLKNPHAFHLYEDYYVALDAIINEALEQI